MAKAFAPARWLRTTLAGDLTLQGLVSTRVYPDRVPATGSYPCVTYAVVNVPNDAIGQPNIYHLSTYEVLVRAHAEGGDKLSLEAILDRILALLHAQAGTTASGTVRHCCKVRDYCPPIELADSANQEFACMGFYFVIEVA